MNRLVRSTVPSALAAAIIALVCESSANAQTNPSLLIDRWTAAPQWASTYDEPMFIDGGHIKGSDDDIDLLYYDSHGRVKFDHDNADPGFWLGYRALTMGINEDVPELPGDLNDISVAAAFRLGDLSTDWRLSVAAGAGTANDGHWANTDAIYGIGTVVATRELDETSRLHIGLDYNGNHTLWPDAPHPVLTYECRLDRDWTIKLGSPSTGFRWTGLHPITVSFDYTVPTNVLANVSYELNKDWKLFGEFGRTVDGFFRNDQGDRRLFYELNRVTAGVHWIKGKLIDLRLGAGYAFNQRFSSGFDIRNLDTVASPSDEVMFFLTVQGTF